MPTSLSASSPYRRMSFSPARSSQVAPARRQEDGPPSATRLQRVPFPAFALTVTSLLESLGYEQVSLVKLMHPGGKGRNANGGYDIRAFMPSRLSSSMVIAQLKQYQRPLPRLAVDELRGTMLRVGASHGLLITTATVSPSAREAIWAGQHAAPIRLIDGTELASLLAEQRTAMPPRQAPAPAQFLPPRMPVKPRTTAACDGTALEVRVDVALFPGKHARPLW